MFELTPFVHNTVNRYDPFRDMEEISRRFFGRDELAAFKTDIKDNGDAYLLEADLPGFDKDNIRIDIDNGYMTISAERHSDVEKKDKKNRVVYSERSFGSFSRSFDVTGIDEKDISAEYNDGVLKITMPKKPETAPTSRRLEIKYTDQPAGRDGKSQ